MSNKFKDGQGYRKRVPLWKWLLVVLLIMAWPLYFSYYRINNLHYILKNIPPAATPQQLPNTHPTK